LAYRIRTRMHRVAGETLEVMSTDLEADSPTLALHFWRAGDAERTWKYAQLAGEQSRKAYANADAAEFYERALDASRRVSFVTDGERSELWTLIGELRELAGVLDGSLMAYRRAAELTADPVQRAEIMGRRAQVHQRAGSPRTAMRVVSTARRLLASRRGPEVDTAAVRLDILMARVRLGQEKSAEARSWALRAVDKARAVRAMDHLATALMMVDHADWQLGVPSEGEHVREALDIYIDRGDLVGEKRARENMGVLAFGAGRWGEALDWYEASRQAAFKAGMDFGAAETELNMAELLIFRGQLGEAEALLSNALRVLRASGIAFHSAFGETLLARIHLARGDLAEADELAARAVEEYTAMGSVQSALEAAIVRSEVAISRGSPEIALELLAEAVEAGTALQPQVQLVRTQAFLALDRLDEAAESVAVGLMSAREQNLPYDEARLLQARSALLMRMGGANAASRAADDAAHSLKILSGMGIST
jgi:tetratricopeptide (TPR) repeat protein